MPTTEIQADKDRLLTVIKEKAFFKEKIILSSGKESDYYIDARRVTMTAEGAYLSAKILLDMVKKEKFAAIGGPTIGADPIVGAMAVLSHQAGESLNAFIIRKQPKAYGKQLQIEGPLIAKGAQVILIDDVATTGKAFIHSIEVLSKSEIKVNKAYCIVDRGEGAKETLAEHNCELISIFTAQDFLS